MVYRQAIFQKNMDIHNYKGQLERTIVRINESASISEDNKKIILGFKDHLLSDGIGLAKINRYLMDAIKYGLMVDKPFKNANKEDIRKVVAELEQTDLAAETKKGFKVMLRKLYRFIRGFEQKGEYPDEVKWLSIHIPENHRKLPEELLTANEIVAIIQKCHDIRDKALVAALAESGCRVSEIGTMKIKHVSFEEHGARLTVNGKTGMRKILIIHSSPYLQAWINRHPDNTNPESYLWINPVNGRFLCYARIAAILKDAAKKAGIRKRVYPHLLRHSRATELASIMSDASMKHYFGWVQGSKMAGIYIHMSGRETDEAILKASGIEIKKNEAKTAMQPKKCQRCNTINEVTNIYCRICGFILDEQKQKEILIQDLKRREADKLMDDLMEDKEFLRFVLQKIREKEGKAQ